MKYSITIISLLLLAAGVQAKDCTSPDPSVNLANGFCDIPEDGTRVDGQGQITADPFYSLDCENISGGNPGTPVSGFSRLLISAANLDCNGPDIGDVVVGSDSVDIFDAPERLTLVEEKVRDLVLDRSQIAGITGSGPVTVGTVTDSVFTDTTDGALVLSMRIDLVPTLPEGGGQVVNESEFNYALRSGNEDFTVQAASSERREGGLRLYNVARTSAKVLGGATPYDPDVVRFQTDVNVSELNPTSRYFHLKTSAECYVEESNAIELNQAGEEGQPNVSIFTTGFVSIDCDDIEETQVPLPWLGILALAFAFSIIGGAVRSRFTA